MVEEGPKYYSYGFTEIYGQLSQEMKDRFLKDAQKTQEEFVRIIKISLEAQKGVNEEGRYWLKKFTKMDEEGKVVVRVIQTGEIAPKLARAILLESRDDDEAAVGIELASELGEALELESPDEVAQAARDVLQAISDFHALWHYAEEEGKQILSQIQFVNRDRDRFSVSVVDEK